jgi:hypothetical protein
MKEFVLRTRIYPVGRQRAGEHANLTNLANLALGGRICDW